MLMLNSVWDVMRYATCVAFEMKRAPINELPFHVQVTFPSLLHDSHSDFKNRTLNVLLIASVYSIVAS